jgi:heat shock transcription factor
LDEDEFAKTLIPELFKHNNYASFVRQLNMYGFHKKVGLSDNSMKASENKRKTPSEYYNKYFRRGRPELLWLIQKPKNPPSAKRKREDGKAGGQGDSDDERKYSPTTESQVQPLTEGGGVKDLTTLPKSELASLKQELANLQRQQKVISNVMQQMKQQNEQFYRQATAFQDMHNRHETSINAILTFLATFYNRSLEGQGNFAELFTHAIPPTNSSQQGNIVDMDEYPEELKMPGPNQMPMRARQPLLLEAPASRSNAASPTSPTTIPSSSRSTMSPKARNPSIFRPQSSAASTPGAVEQSSSSTPVIKTDTETPNMVSDNQGMMSVIQAANSASPQTAGSLDLNKAIDHFSNQEGPMTPQQREHILNQMQSTMNANPATSSNSDIANQALMSANSLKMPMSVPMPASNEQIEALQRLTDAQNAQIASLVGRLSPLSPSGNLFDHNGNADAPPSDFDLDQLVDYSNDYFPPTEGYNVDDYNADFNNGGMNFGFDGTNEGDVGTGVDVDASGADGTFNGFLSENEAKLPGQHGQVESVSSRGTSPVDSAAADEEVSSANKRRRIAT